MYDSLSEFQQDKFDIILKLFVPHPTGAPPLDPVCPQTLWALPQPVHTGDVIVYISTQKMTLQLLFRRCKCSSG